MATVRLSNDEDTCRVCFWPIRWMPHPKFGPAGGHTWQHWAAEARVTLTGLDHEARPFTHSHQWPGDVLHESSDWPEVEA